MFPLEKTPVSRLPVANPLKEYLWRARKERHLDSLRDYDDKLVIYRLSQSVHTGVFPWGKYVLQEGIM